MMRQHGITFIGLVVVLAIAGFFAVIGIKMFPSYTEFFSVKGIIESIGNGSEFQSLSEDKIRSSFDRSANIGYVSAVSAKDLVISNNAEGKKILSVEYQVVKPIIGNVSVMMNFKTSTDQTNIDFLKK